MYTGIVLSAVEHPFRGHTALSAFIFEMYRKFMRALKAGLHLSSNKGTKGVSKNPVPQILEVMKVISQIASLTLKKIHF
jgi:hypothetical protein